jgi:subtilisin family serine protease
MSYEYQVNGKKVTLNTVPNLVAVRYKEPAPHSARAAHARFLGTKFDDRFEVPNEKFTVFNASAVGPTHGIQSQNTDDDQIARRTPVFEIGKIKVLATDRVLVGLNNEQDPIEPLVQQFGAVSIESRGSGEYTIHLAEDVDPMSAATRLAQLPGVSYAEPDFVNISTETHADADASRDSNMLVGTLARPRGGLSHEQRGASLTIQLSHEVISIADREYHIAISPLLEGEKQRQEIDGHREPGLRQRESSADARYATKITLAEQAWEEQAGDEQVRIAILDEGVDTRHPDLRHAIVAGFDSADGDEFQEPNAWDGHGTACAGLAAAMPSIPEGMRGIGGGCGIMAVRIAYSSEPGGPWVTTNSGIAKSVDWSWKNGADVLSNSWGGGAPSNAIVSAFTRARRHGRGGKGCVLVAAAGNNAGPVSFPASLDGIIAVSATNEFDEFKTKSSRDGENWGSNFGPEICLGAPGVHNFTTDITGASGYNGGGNYYDRFNGTSSATPLVAGACALLISAKPDAHEREIRDALEQSADKVGNKAYVNGRNDQLGYGRLNVLRALRRLMNSPN